MEIGLVLLVIAVIFVTKSVKVVPQQHAWVVWTYPDSTDRYWLDSQADDDTGAGLSTAAGVACDERDAAVGNPCWV